MEIMGKELSHAAQCLEIYLRNEREIYDRYTVPAIERATKNAKLAGSFIDWAAYPHIVADWGTVNGAIQVAVRMVRKYDGLKPTAEDIETVKAGYVADIIDKAKYKLINDIRKKLDGFRFELQKYYDNASKGLPETRRRNMVLLRWDIRRLKNEIKKYM